MVNLYSVLFLPVFFLSSFVSIEQNEAAPFTGYNSYEKTLVLGIEKEVTLSIPSEKTESKEVSGTEAVGIPALDELRLDEPGIAELKIDKQSNRPKVPEHILGKGIIPAKKLSNFLRAENPEINEEFIKELALLYTEEAAIEGINHDTAFAQMCLETGFLGYGGLVTMDMNNFCGLGSIGPGQIGLSFPNPRTGVRAHIQHLKAYATQEPVKQLLVDPRYSLVRLGSSPQIKGLAGTWAADLAYAEKINRILERLYSFSFGG